MKKILLINSNTNEKATEVIHEGIKPYISNGMVIDCVNADLGPQGIDTPLDTAISALETVRIVAKNRDKYDAFIVACGFDPGLDASRNIVEQPVVGLAEASMLMACMLGHKFSIFTTNDTYNPIYDDLVNHYRLQGRLASIRGVGLTTAELENREKLFQRLIEVGKVVVKEDGAEVILLPGSVMVGLEKDLSKILSVPVLAGIICAIKMVEGLLGYGQKTSKIGKYKPLNKQDSLIGYEDLNEVYSAKS